MTKQTTIVVIGSLWVNTLINKETDNKTNKLADNKTKLLFLVLYILQNQLTKRADLHDMSGPIFLEKVKYFECHQLIILVSRDSWT